MSWRSTQNIGSPKQTNSYLLSTGKFSDVEIIVGYNKVKINAHKLILMTHSSVFEEMFEQMEPKLIYQITLPDVDSNIFLSFLKFIYYNEFVKTIDEAVRISYLAYKYNVTNLQSRCSNYLESNMTFANVIRIFNYVKTIKQPELAKEAWEFILRNVEEFFLSPEFLEIDENNLEILLKKDLEIREISIFNAVLRWAENSCKVNGVECIVENKRRYMLDFFQYIRFSVMSVKELQGIVRKNKNLLKNSEIVKIFLQIETTNAANITIRRGNLSTNHCNPNPTHQEKATVELYNGRIRKLNNYNEEKYMFWSDHDIFITGIEFFGASCQHHRNIQSSEISSTAEKQENLNNRFIYVSLGIPGIDKIATSCTLEDKKLNSTFVKKFENEPKLLKDFSCRITIRYPSLFYYGYGTGNKTDANVQCSFGLVKFGFIHGHCEGRLKAIHFKLAN